MDSKTLFVTWLIGYSLANSLSWAVYYKFSHKKGESVGLAAAMSLCFWIVVTVKLWPF